MSWGRGWEVGVRKAIWKHEKARALAAEILQTECGIRHDTGSRRDLCPNCQALGGLRDATGESSGPSSQSRVESEPTL